ARLHAAVLPLPAVERGRGDAMLTTQIIDRGAGVCLAENSYDLLVCEPALPHPVLLSRTDIIAGSGSGEHFRPSHHCAGLRRPHSPGCEYGGGNDSTAADADRGTRGVGNS